LTKYIYNLYYKIFFFKVKESISIQEKRKEFFSLVLLNFLFTFIIIVVGGIISAIINHNLYEKVTPFLKTESLIYRYLLSLTIVPLFEELGFRLLILKNKINFSVSLTLITYFICSIFLDLSDYKNEVSYFYVKLIGLLCIIWGVFYVLYDQVFKMPFEKIDTIKLVYITSFLFALLHLSNFSSLNFYQIIFSPVLILPHFVFALSAGYIRVQHGFFLAVLFHSLTNLIVIMIQIIKNA